MEFSTHAILVAFGLTLFAGLSTGIGSAIAFLSRQTNRRFLSLALGFSAGVMIYISFVEIFPDARETLEHAFDERTATLIATLAFFAGMALIAIIDKLIPSGKNPHEVKSVESMNAPAARDEKLTRLGLFSALAIAIHNFPEGLATFVSGLSDPAIAYPIAIAIALHNIPEGIAVSVPVYFATGNRRKAFVYSFLSGLAEPVGAIVGFFLIASVVGVSPMVIGVLFSLVAGIMVFISLDELLPTAKEYGAHHLSIYGLVAGMALMAFSLLLL
ncbi:MAG: zinc transporter ZupT [Odoribacteraceae bacterium]|nr:zinc transporter ZupT [Odoribacteraceae bacterium]